MQFFLQRLHFLCSKTSNERARYAYGTCKTAANIKANTHRRRESVATPPVAYVHERKVLFLNSDFVATISKVILPTYSRLKIELCHPGVQARSERCLSGAPCSSQACLISTRASFSSAIQRRQCLLRVKALSFILFFLICPNVKFDGQTWAKIVQLICSGIILRISSTATAWIDNGKRSRHAHLGLHRLLLTRP